MASLFSKNKLRDLASKYKTEDLQDKIELVKIWLADYRDGTLKLDKETSREQAYNQTFFIQILGYKEKPARPYSIEPKATTEKGQLPDVILGQFDSTGSVNNLSAVVELKGASVELDRPQRREGNFSPIQQAFKYKTQYRNCPFVIVSNFYEFRLYQDNQLDFEIWTLDDLVNPADDYINFKVFYYLLCYNNFTSSKGKSNTEELLSDVRTEQKEIGKKFYKTYKQARLDLLRNIYKNNEIVRDDIELGIEKAQKIVDRIVFACFAEDRGLLPENTIARVQKSAENGLGSLWTILKGFFEAIDTGSDKLDIPNGYDGGMFEKDDILDSFKIDDRSLKTVLELSKYDFQEELSVDILGHIFEQSISDIEEIVNKVHVSNNLETALQSKRKKEGIFYTPDYIIRYIVENTLGTYLREAEDRFKKEAKLKGDINDKNYLKRERSAYINYQHFLQNVKVLDPACGSGAFLVKVFDYLMEENKRVASILGNLFGDENYIKSILQNNIYGVDLNTESVEITKLSLWLKSAEKGKKLTSLNNNIKCGNSLIDDESIANAKAFKWEKEFKEIIKSGGFDVVIGNPPYVFTREGGFEESEKEHIAKYVLEKGITTVSKGLNIQTGKINLYAIFMVKSLGLLKENGKFSFIIPNSILRATPYEAIRKYLLENFTIKAILDLGAGIFEQATVATIIIVIEKSHESSNKIKIIKDVKNLSYGDYVQSSASQNFFLKNVSYIFNILMDDINIEVTNKINSNTIILKDIAKYISPGIDGDKDKFVSKTKENERYKPLLFGKSFGRYSLKFNNDYIYYDRSKLNRARKEEIFTSPKIILQRISGGRSPLRGTYDKDGYYTFNSVNNIILKSDSPYNLLFILALINSKVLNWYYSNNFSNQSNLTVNISKTLIEQLPIPKKVSKEDQLKIVSLVNKIIEFNTKLTENSNKFIMLVSEEFNLPQWPRSLSNWWNIDFSGFAAALKLDLDLSKKDQLLELFQKYKKENLKIVNEIQEIDGNINQIIYVIYGLNSEEVLLIEKNIDIGN